jgi:hypothetical protein
MTAFRGSLHLQPAPLLNSVVRQQGGFLMRFSLLFFVAVFLVGCGVGSPTETSTATATDGKEGKTADKQVGATDPQSLRWDENHTQKPLTISKDGLTLSWNSDSKAAWLGSQTTARLSKGVFTWDFKIEEIAERQIGVGILLDPPNWGFFGYLGAGKNAWSYDAFEGAIVTEEEAIHSGLPKIGKSGTVSVRIDLKRKNECVFIVDGKETPAISLPQGAVVIPAACLLKKGQVLTLANLKRLE